MTNCVSVSFQESILSIVPSAIFLAIAGPRAFYLFRSPDKTKRHATYTPKLVRTLLVVFLNILAKLNYSDHFRHIFYLAGGFNSFSSIRQEAQYSLLTSCGHSQSLSSFRHSFVGSRRARQICSTVIHSHCIFICLASIRRRSTSYRMAHVTEHCVCCNSFNLDNLQVDLACTRND